MARIATGISDLNNEISSNEFVIVGITASWCSQCKMIKPMMNGIEEEYKEKVKFIEIDQDKNPEISSKYNVISLPTFLFFVNGEKKEVFQMRPKSYIQNLIKSYINGGKNDWFNNN